MKETDTNHFDKAEDSLLNLGRRLQTEPTTKLSHPAQTGSPEWQGADVIVTSDFAWKPPDFVGAHDLVVRTRHAAALTWLFLELQDAFDPWLNASNKYTFFESLARAAEKHLATNQPEADDAHPLLSDVLNCGFAVLRDLRENGTLPMDATVVLHSTDAEGRQKRHNLGTRSEEPPQPEN